MAQSTIMAQLVLRAQKPILNVYSKYTLKCYLNFSLVRWKGKSWGNNSQWQTNHKTEDFDERIPVKETEKKQGSGSGHIILTKIL